MERLEFVSKEGSMIRSLPPGFRFQPTDEELVFQYLKHKVFGYPLPASVIPLIANLSNFDPWDLPGNSSQERYFFSKNEAKNGNRTKRTTCSGYWKATGMHKHIPYPSDDEISGNGKMMGMKKTLVFFKGKSPHGSRTNWVMHEYCLTCIGEGNSSTQKQTEDWVVCRIFLKKIRATKREEEEEEIRKEERRDDVEGNSNSSSTGLELDLSCPLSPAFSSSGSSWITG
ncbi:NAC domain-containing protein 83-like [Malania oleifera]|uniref:NAC domain-containing protein 83-like n=1 Tax=Malania oleifera TaxID=397392 RepID=UPI0025ADED80|nr:NAC domain-containing protein 83-like [Malania oleifera]